MQLSSDVKNMKKNSKLLIPADKTNNLFKLKNIQTNNRKHK